MSSLLGLIKNKWTQIISKIILGVLLLLVETEATMQGKVILTLYLVGLLPNTNIK